MFIPYFLKVSIERKAVRTKVHSILQHLMAFMKDIYLNFTCPRRPFLVVWDDQMTANVDPVNAQPFRGNLNVLISHHKKSPYHTRKW